MAQNLYPQCFVCGERAQVIKARVRRFSQPLRIFGWLNLIPSLLVCIASAIGICSVNREAIAAGETSTLAMGGVVGAWLFASALAWALFGWWLVSRKEALVCASCGSIKGQLAN